MLAMCVRKTADTGGTPTSMQAPVPPFASSTTTTTKRKLKGLRSRGSGSTKKQSESTTTAGGLAGTSGSSSSLKKHHQQQHQYHHAPASEKTSGCSTTVNVDCTVKVRDDPEGHLIYRKGDVVDSRCKCMAVLKVVRGRLGGWTVCVLC